MRFYRYGRQMINLLFLFLLLLPLFSCGDSTDGNSGTQNRDSQASGKSSPTSGKLPEIRKNLDAGVQNISLSGQAGSRITYTDSGGADIYTVMPGMVGDVKVYDNQAGKIILPAGLSLTAARFTSNGVQFTVNGFTVSFIGKPNLFTFVFAGNATTPGAGVSKTFAETAGIFGTSIPSSGQPNDATITGTIQSDGSLLSSKNGLVAYYAFDGNALDSSGNGNDGIESGNISYIDAKVGKGVRLHGVSSVGGPWNPDFIRVPNSESLKFSNEMTVSYYIRLDGTESMDGYGNIVTGSWGSVFAKSGDRAGIWTADSADAISFAYDSYAGGESISAVSQPSALTNFRHVAYVVSPTSVKIYVNGTLASEKAMTVKFSSSNTQDIYIGTQFDLGRYWFGIDGTIDELRIYNRSLSSSEVQQLAGETTSPPSTPTGLSATASSSTSISLTWTASTDDKAVVGYRIYRNGTRVKTLGAVTSWTDTGLTASTNYCYQVSAFDENANEVNAPTGESAKSTQVCATTSGSGTGSDEIKGKVIDGPVSGATVKAYAPGTEEEIGSAVIGSDGSFTLTTTKKFAEYYLIATGGTHSGQAFAGAMSAICTSSTLSTCNLTPYSTLLATLADQYSGSLTVKLGKAKELVFSKLGVNDDPFIRELSGAAVTDVDLAKWRDVIVNGLMLDLWAQAVMGDLVDGYAESDAAVMFIKAAKRPSVTVSKTDFTVDDTTIPAVGQQGENVAVTLPEGTTVTRKLCSLLTGEQGATITSKDYLSDVAYTETQNFSTVSSDPKYTTESIVYQSFNAGRWKGRLDADTTVLANIFMRTPALIFLPASEKERVAEILVQNDAFKQAVDEYKRIISSAMPLDQDLLDSLITSLGDIGKGLIDASQIRSSARSLAAKMSPSLFKVPAGPISSSFSRKYYAKAAVETNFQVFKGMAINFDPKYPDKLKFKSNSSLWYGIQTNDKYESGSILDNLNTSMIKPKLGFFTADGFDMSDPSTWYLTNSVDTSISMADLGINGTNSPVTEVLYRGSLLSGDVPAVMNTLTVLQIVLETAGACGNLAGTINPPMVISKMRWLYDKTAIFKDKFKNQAVLICSSINTAILVFDMVKETGYSSNLKKIMETNKSIFDALGAGSQPSIKTLTDGVEFEIAKAEFWSAIKSIAKGKTPQFDTTFSGCVMPFIVSSFLVQPIAKAAGDDDLKGAKAYQLACSLLNPNDKSKSKLNFIQTISIIINSSKGATILSEIRANLSFINKIGDYIVKIGKSSFDLSKLPIADIVGEILKSLSSEFSGFALEAGFNLLKDLTPAKYFDLVLAGNKMGALLYDWITDPSIVKMTIEKQSDGTPVMRHSIPDLKAIRYLKMKENTYPGSGNKYVPLLVDAKTPIWNQRTCDGNSLRELGSGGEDNHFLVMSGFECSVENQTAYNKNEDAQIEVMIKSKNIQMLWHCARFESSYEVRPVPRSERNASNPLTFNGNFIQANVEDSILWFNDSIISPDSSNPMHTAILGQDISSYYLVDFTEFYKNKAGDKSEFPLKHKTPGIFSDYTNIFYKSGNDEKIFENTINVYVLPDFSAYRNAILNSSAIYSDGTQKELQIPFYCHTLEPNNEPLKTLWVVLKYNNNCWSSPLRIDLSSLTFVDKHAFQLPSNVSKVFIYNDTLKSYAERSGEGIIKVLGDGAKYIISNQGGAAPFVVLDSQDISKMQSATTSMLNKIDSDHDGINDDWDAFKNDPRYSFDSDQDGIADEWEKQYGLDPYVNNAVENTQDRDGDGLGNSMEFKNNCNPDSADTDNDGMPDKWEVDNSLRPDNAGDADQDPDADGVNNLDEYKAGTDPLVKNAMLPPSNISAVPGDGKVTITWTAPAGAVSSGICIATEHITDPLNCITPSGTSVWHANKTSPATISGLVNGTTYYFVVVAEDSAGKPVAGAEQSFKPVSGTVTATGKLNDTGITWWANGSSNGLASPQADYPGQDADSGRDVTHKDDKDEYRGGSAGFNYTKIGANGETLPVVAENWSAVLDNVTGLMWEMKTDDGGLHDKDNTYTWYEPDNTKNGGSAGKQNGGTCPEGNCDTYSFVQAVNAGAGYCGKKDWRMPTRMELLSIVNHGTINPSIDTRFFLNTQASGFWSSSPHADNGYSAWAVPFLGGGIADFEGKGNGNYVRLLCSGQ